MKLCHAYNSDTVATIFINDAKVFYTDNQFHRIRLEVKPFLKASPNVNTMRVEFESKVLEASKRAASCDPAEAIT